MAEWFETGARYVGKADDGTEKRVTERYMVSAATCTEAEALTVGRLEGETDLEVKSVASRDISDVIRGADGGRWYLGKVMFTDVDGKGKERRTASQYLVSALDLRHALEGIEDFLRGSLTDWEVASVGETRITDVIDGRQ